MTARLKVWGGLVSNSKRCSKADRTGQVRTIVAAKNQREAAALVKCSMYEFRNYWSETGNDVEVATALAWPGVVFQASTSMGCDFEPTEDVYS